MATDDLYIAIDSGLTRFGGRDVVIEAGRTIVRAGHPLLKGREHMFGPLEVHYDVESPAEKPPPARPAVKAPAGAAKAGK